MQDEEEIRKYIETKVNPLLGPLMVQLLSDRPTDIVEYIQRWMKTKGRHLTPSPMQFRLKTHPSRDNSMISCQSVVNTKRTNTLPSRVAGSKQNNEKVTPPQVVQNSNSDSESEDDDQVASLAVIQKPKNQRHRCSVSAESYGKYNQKGVMRSFKAREIPKTFEQKERIKARLMKSFMFQALDKDEFDIVVNAMEIKEFRTGEWIIKQGDDGDYLYVVDQGESDCMKVFVKGDPPTQLKVYVPGESFGELSLLYNAPRAASIRAKTDSVCFALDRECFNNIVKESAIKKREHYEIILKKVDILNTLSSFEITQICDTLGEQSFNKGDFIIRQGEIGDVFYMVAEGELIATKQMKPDEEAIKVWQYKQGDYFGELALLKEQPRQANIIGVSKGKIVFLRLDAFTRLFGPLKDILSKNAEKYLKYLY